MSWSCQDFAICSQQPIPYWQEKAKTKRLGTHLLPTFAMPVSASAWSDFPWCHFFNWFPRPRTSQQHLHHPRQDCRIAGKSESMNYWQFLSHGLHWILRPSRNRQPGVSVRFTHELLFFIKVLNIDFNFSISTFSQRQIVNSSFGPKAIFFARHHVHAQLLQHFATSWRKSRVNRLSFLWNLCLFLIIYLRNICSKTDTYHLLYCIGFIFFIHELSLGTCAM